MLQGIKELEKKQLETAEDVLQNGIPDTTQVVHIFPDCVAAEIAIYDVWLANPVAYFWFEYTCWHENVINNEEPTI